MSKLAALLGGMTLNELAKEVLQLQGRKGDTELAHVNKREAALLQEMGGSGTTNPQTGMPEFYDGLDEYSTASYGDVPAGAYSYERDYIPAQQTGAYDMGQFQATDMGGAQPTGAYDMGQFAPQDVGGIQPTGAYDMGQFSAADIGAIAPRPPENLALGQERFARDYLPNEMAAIPSEAPTEPSTAAETAIDKARQYAERNPALTRALATGALSLPQLMASRRARKEAAATRAELERNVAPIRAEGQRQLESGQRGELTATQQQQVAALQAAQAQDLARRGQTAGTAAEQARLRTQEFAQRLVQNNIDNGVRLIGAANSGSAQAIQMAYRMNQDANQMTQAYFTNLMRASGALPGTTVIQQAPAATG